MKKLDQVFAYVAKTKDQEAYEQRSLDQKMKLEKMNNLRDQL